MATQTLQCIEDGGLSERQELQHGEILNVAVVDLSKSVRFVASSAQVLEANWTPCLWPVLSDLQMCVRSHDSNARIHKVVEMGDQWILGEFSDVVVETHRSTPVYVVLRGILQRGQKFFTKGNCIAGGITGRRRCHRGCEKAKYYTPSTSNARGVGICKV